MLVRSLPLLEPGRFAITVSSTHENAIDERIRSAFFIVEPNQRQLMEIAALIDTYKLRTWVKATLPLAQANDAYTSTIPGHGKVVVAVDPRAI
jgi:NADPH:quinone reductase-like Zn-dependent oxidoreductase